MRLACDRGADHDAQPVGRGPRLSRRPALVRVPVRAPPPAGVPLVHLRRRGGESGQRAAAPALDLAAVRRRVHPGVRGHGRRRRRRRPAAHPLPARTDHRRRRLHRRQRSGGGRRHPSAQAGHAGHAPARGRGRRLSHRRGSRHRLDAVRRVRPRRHPQHGRLEPERAVRSRCSFSSTRSAWASPSCWPPWPSTG